MCAAWSLYSLRRRPQWTPLRRSCHSERCLQPNQREQLSKTWVWAFELWRNGQCRNPIHSKKLEQLREMGIQWWMFPPNMSCQQLDLPSHEHWRLARLDRPRMPFCWWILKLHVVKENTHIIVIFSIITTIYHISYTILTPYMIYHHHNITARRLVLPGDLQGRSRHVGHDDDDESNWGGRIKPLLKNLQWR